MVCVVVLRCNAKLERCTLAKFDIDLLIGNCYTVLQHRFFFFTSSVLFYFLFHLNTLETRYKQTPSDRYTHSHNLNDSNPKKNLHYHYYNCQIYMCVYVYMFLQSSIHKGDRYISFYKLRELECYKIINNNKSKSSNCINRVLNYTKYIGERERKKEIGVESLNLIY